MIFWQRRAGADCRRKASNAFSFRYGARQPHRKVLQFLTANVVIVEIQLDKQSFVICICKQLNFIDARIRLRFSQFPKTRKRPIDQCRANRTLVDWQQGPRALAKITNRKCGFVAKMETCAMAVVQWRRSMGFDRDFQREFGRAQQLFPQNVSFESKLLFVAGVLVMAAAATSEVRTRGRTPQGGW